MDTEDQKHKEILRVLKGLMVHTSIILFLVTSTVFKSKVREREVFSSRDLRGTRLISPDCSFGNDADDDVGDDDDQVTTMNR